ncbi:glycerol-3-phosphate dehydrogenase [Texas Phoenix palm phytoplasma]|uniref:Glycerol-3-phosphate dehydrogenase n=1 Tax=Texas Phoenix palm phytoplasma TaxID=176709 RepID=A0ABS5BI39_9MOLU|nr:NAD(P)H-dependent glycerol-3-phosphate dehydrogenase [Texas Phoenix palm phytoplasma]MBP3059248.1 glycerol-3-phosphate dehydrogenase [Texas Phoenix palm phytoplasma]
MYKITIIGGGAWGTALGQVLADNNNKVLIYDINKEYIKRINLQKHPFLNISLKNICGTNSLKESINFSKNIILCLPTKNIRKVCNQINEILTEKKNFINVSKGTEVKSNKFIYQILKEEIDENKIQNYACLMGPSHAEEVILRKITFLLSASQNNIFAYQVAKMFSNDDYFKVFVSDDVIGCEICSSFKNALSLISGIIDNENFEQNAKAAFIFFGIEEMKKILKFFTKKEKTCFGLAGIGDLIVTSFNKNSRNYKAGQKIALGYKLDDINRCSKQTIEGINNLKVFYDISVKNNINLCLINSAYKVVFENKPVSIILQNIFQKNDFNSK